MGGHFDAVGFGDPGLGFEATRGQLRRAVREGLPLAETEEYRYYRLEAPEGCGLVAATDLSGFLLNGCPYLRARARVAVAVEAQEPWEPTAPDQGGGRGQLLLDGGQAGPRIAFALPAFAVAARTLPGVWELGLVGLGYHATTRVGTGRPRYLRSQVDQAELPPIRRCNVECRGRIEQAELIANSLTGARLARATLDCDPVRLEIAIDLASLEGGLTLGADLEGSFWLVAQPD